MIAAKNDIGHERVSIHKPVVMNYLICPHVPENVGTLLTPEGEPVLMDYAKIPWKKLAQKLQQDVEDTNVPKAIKVYVGNDAIDLFDINGMDMETGQERLDWNPINTATEGFRNSNLSDFRGGVCTIPGNLKDFHLNKPVRGKRPPIAAFFVSIRFANISQLTDYIGGVSETVIGTLDYPDIDGTKKPMSDPFRMPSAFAQWLREEIGVVYADECSVISLATTFSRV